eukprot:4264251-Pyramimonas_sp.AAC.1
MDGPRPPRAASFQEVFPPPRPPDPLCAPPIGPSLGPGSVYRPSCLGREGIHTQTHRHTDTYT